MISAVLKKYFANQKSLLDFIKYFYLANISLFCLAGLKFLNVILSSKTLFNTTFYSYNSLLGKCLVLAFTFFSFVGQFTLLATFPFIVLLILTWLYPKRIFIFTAAIFLFSSSLLILLADSLVFSIFHFHINLTILKIAFGERVGLINFLELSNSELLMIGGVFFIIVIIEIGLALLIAKKLLKRENLFPFKKIIAILFGSLFVSYVFFILSVVQGNNVFAQQTPNLPLYNNVLAAILPIKNSAALIDLYSETRFSQPLFPTSPLHYPLHELMCQPKKSPLNILIIGIDTWRFDAMNKLLTPNIEKFSHNAWQFNQHYSGGNSTQAGLFSLFYSLPSSYWTSMLQQKRGAVFIEELLKQNYQAEVFYSSDISVPPMNKTIFYDLKNIRSSPAPGRTTVDRDYSVTQDFQEFIKNKSKSKPFFAFLFYDAAHNYCQTSDLPKVFPVKKEVCNRVLTSHAEMNEAYHHYENGVHFVDDEVQKVLNTLKVQHELEHTIIIITGDHGEEFDDNHKDYWGHGSNYTRYQVQTPLVIYWPKQKPKIFSYPTNHYDIVPTLMHEALGCKNNFNDYSIGENLLTSSLRPYVLVGSYINMGIFQKDKNITLLTSGNIRTADSHANFMPDAKPDENLISTVLLQMRKYYH